MDGVFGFSCRLSGEIVYPCRKDKVSAPMEKLRYLKVSLLGPELSGEKSHRPRVIASLIDHIGSHLGDCLEACLALRTLFIEPVGFSRESSWQGVLTELFGLGQVDTKIESDVEWMQLSKDSGGDSDELYIGEDVKNIISNWLCGSSSVSPYIGSLLTLIR